MMNRFGFFLVVLVLVFDATSVHPCRTAKRNEVEQFSNAADDKTSPKDKNDVFVETKRAALLLDRLMVALHHALEDDETGGRKLNQVYREGAVYSKIRHPTIKSIDANKLKSLLSSKELEDTPDDVIIRTIEDASENSQSAELMDLQRRGHDEGLEISKGRVYWRCYFNAVTCF